MTAKVLYGRRILIAGGAGFVGRALTGHLLSKGADVAWLEPHSVEVPPGITLHMGCPPGDYHWPKGTFTDLILSSSGDNREPFPQKSISFFEAGISTPFYLVQWAIKNEVSHIVVLSSGSVYFMDGLSRPGATLNKLPTFNESIKYAEELLLRHFSAYTYLHFIRLFRPYGPGKSTSLVNSAVQRLIEGKPVKLKSPDGPFIQPTFLDDLAAAVMHLLSIKESNIIDLAGKERVTLGEVVRLFGEIAHLTPTFQLLPEKARHDREIHGSGIKEIDRLIITPLNQGLKIFL